MTFQAPSEPWMQYALFEHTWQGRFQNLNFLVLFRAHFPTICNQSPKCAQKLPIFPFQAPSAPWVQLVLSECTWGYPKSFCLSGVQSTLSKYNWFTESLYFTQNLQLGFMFLSRTQIRFFLLLVVYLQHLVIIV